MDNVGKAGFVEAGCGFTFLVRFGGASVHGLSLSGCSFADVLERFLDLLEVDGGGCCT